MGDEGDHTPAEHDGDDSLKGPYCICRGPDDGSSMICCDSCDEWYHLKCIGMSSGTADILSQAGEFHCDRCRPNQKKQAPPPNSPQTNVIKSPKEEKPVVQREASKRQANKEKERTTPKKSLPPTPKKPTEEETTRSTARNWIDAALGGHQSSIADAIESSLFSLYRSTNREYKTKLRSIRFNLQDTKNPQLRANVINGSLTPNDLVTLDVAAMASTEIAELRKARDEQSLNNVVLPEETISVIANKGNVDNSQAEVIVPDLALPTLNYQPAQPVPMVNAPVTEIVVKRSEEEKREGEEKGEGETFDIPSFGEFHKEKKRKTEDDVIPEVIEEKMNTWSGQLKTSSTKFHVRGTPSSTTPPSVVDHMTGVIVQVGRMDIDKMNQYLNQIKFSTSRHLCLLLLEPEGESDKKEYEESIQSFLTNRKALVVNAGQFKESFVVPIEATLTTPPWADTIDLKESVNCFVAAIIIDAPKAEKKEKDREHKKTKSPRDKMSSPPQSQANVYTPQPLPMTQPPLSQQQPPYPYFPNTSYHAGAPYMFNGGGFYNAENKSQPASVAVQHHVPQSVNAMGGYGSGYVTQAYGGGYTQNQHQTPSQPTPSQPISLDPTMLSQLQHLLQTQNVNR
ncbi:hypothetical protein PROFUN_09101 [Planoprotostelium fungivorum]|uniref:Transcription factor BYE1 n=1 Tax=Planoprotostelium fungivorum TaxID=1890364 RepID=A0A2P6NHZ1_9EUKA|nr:hypothetical protein PROFUN_09101 [Planoprotostelium fungivorum]